MRILLILSIFINISALAEETQTCEENAVILIKAETNEQLPHPANKDLQLIYNDKDAKLISGQIESEVVDLKKKTIQKKRILSTQEVLDGRNADEKNDLNVINLQEDIILAGDFEISIDNKRNRFGKTYLSLNTDDMNQFISKSMSKIDDAQICSVEDTMTTLIYDKNKNTLVTKQTTRINIKLN